MSKHHMLGPLWKTIRTGRLLAVEMSKKRTPFWREERLEVKSIKSCRLEAYFDVSDVFFLADDGWIDVLLAQLVKLVQLVSFVELVKLVQLVSFVE